MWELVLPTIRDAQRGSKRITSKSTGADDEKNSVGCYFVSNVFGTGGYASSGDVSAGHDERGFCTSAKSAVAEPTAGAVFAGHFYILGELVDDGIRWEHPNVHGERSKCESERLQPPL